MRASQWCTFGSFPVETPHCVSRFVLHTQAAEAGKQVEEAAHVTNLASLRDQYAGLEQAASAGAFWEDQESAQATLQEMSELRGIIQEMEGFQGLLGDVQTAVELAEMEAGPLFIFSEYFLGQEVHLDEPSGPIKLGYPTQPT